MAKVGRKSIAERDFRLICMARFNAWAGNNKCPWHYRVYSNVMLSNILGLTDQPVNMPGTRPLKPKAEPEVEQPVETLEPATSEEAEKMAADWMKT